MKITAFDDLYPMQLGTGSTTLYGATGSNSGITGGDVVGEPGDLSVIRLGSTVSLGSNLSTGVALGDVLTIIQASPAVARFATPSNTSTGSNAMLRTMGGHSTVTTIAASGTAKTLMVGGANYFDVTLNANCTFGFTGWAPSGNLSEIGVRLTEDTTGGWTPSFPTVTWIGGTPTHDTTANTATEYVFWTNNAGSSVFGGQLGTAVAYGSNATRVSETAGAGAGASVARATHLHDGIGTITSSSSNTMQRGTWNLRPGSGIALTLSDTDGDGEFDTTTIVNTGQGGGGAGSGSGMTTLVKSSDQAVINSDVLTSDTALTFAMTANTHYAIEIQVFFDTTAAGDFKWSATTPTSPTLFRYRQVTAPGGASVTATAALQAAFPSGLSSSLTGTGTNGGYVGLWITFQNGSNAGTFAFQFAQNTATNDTGAIVRAGSWLSYKSA